MKVVCSNIRDNNCETCPLNELEPKQFGYGHGLMSETANWHRNMDVNSSTDEALRAVLEDEASINACHAELPSETIEVIMLALRQSASVRCSTASVPEPTVSVT